MGMRIPHAENAAKRKIHHEGAPLKLQVWELLDSGEVLFTFKCGSETKKAIVTKSDEIAELNRYESENYKCGLCGGDGLKWCGWNHIDGHRFKKCSRCHGSGLPNLKNKPCK